MKPILKILAVCLIIGEIIFLSCKKEHSCENCRETNKPPTAVAGPDQVITLPTDSISLDGSASNDPDGKISEWLWTKIGGPDSFTIVHRNDSMTEVKNLVAGIYLFELKVTDNGGLMANDTVQVTVNAGANRPPIANAGADTTITLPANSVTLNGSGSTDPDNNITSYQWTKISGPSSFTIANSSAVQTEVTGLVGGVYQFELIVTDNGGLFSKDTMQVTVNVQTSPPSPGCDNSNRPLINAQLIPVGTLSQARRDIAVASAGDKILFAGGGNYPGPSSFVSSRVDIYDITTNTWSTAELSLGRTWIGAIAAGNKIFFAGGIIGGDDLNVVDIYDASTSAWSVSHLTNESSFVAAATAGNKVLFAGGNWGIGATGSVDIYDLMTNTWSTASLSAPRNIITAISADNKAYFTGGDPWTGQASNVIDVYDGVSGAWSTSTLLVPRGYNAGIAVNDILYLAGGANEWESSPFCSVETLNTNTGAHTLMNLFDPASWLIDAGQNAVLKDNEIIFLRHDGGIDANRFDIYDTQSNTWSIGVLPQPVPQNASVISVNNTIYVAGGIVNGVLSNQVWKLEF